MFKKFFEAIHKAMIWVIVLIVRIVMAPVRIAIRVVDFIARKITNFGKSDILKRDLAEEYSPKIEKR